MADLRKGGPPEWRTQIVTDCCLINKIRIKRMYWFENEVWNKLINVLLTNSKAADMRSFFVITLKLLVVLIFLIAINSWKCSLTH